VQAVQQRWREEAEKNPTRFFWRTLPAEMAGVRRRVAEFVGAGSHRCVMTPNVTSAIAMVLATVPLQCDAEVLITADSYPAVRAGVAAACRRAGAGLVVAEPPAPTLDARGVASALLGRVTSRTRVAIIDHVTSPTALLVDVAPLVAQLRDRGIVVVVDGAHAPGSTAVQVATIAADFYAGSFHKWCCAPRGAAFLAVHPQWADRVVPVVPGARLEEGFPSGLEWWGTADYSALLCVPAALGFFEALGWERVRQHNRELVSRGRDMVCAAMGLDEPGDSPIGMAAIALATNGVADYSRQLREELAAGGVEVATADARGATCLRLSAHLYNRPRDFERLAALLRSLQDTRRSSGAH
jgi:isopenicillin-N epimerase